MKDGRLHLRLSQKLINHLKKVAAERNLSLSQLVAEQLETLVREYEQEKYKLKHVDAEQI